MFAGDGDPVDLRAARNMKWVPGTGWPRPQGSGGHVYQVVPAGTPIYMPDGQQLDVWGHSAVGLGNITFCTQEWLDSYNHNVAMAARPWWRKLFGLSPAPKKED